MIYKGYKIVKSGNFVSVKIKLPSNEEKRKKWKKVFNASTYDTAKSAIDLMISNELHQKNLKDTFISKSFKYYDILYSKFNNFPDEDGKLYEWGKGLSTAMYVKGAFDYQDLDHNEKLYSKTELEQLFKSNNISLELLNSI